MVLTSTYEVQEEYTSLSQSKSGLEEYHERSERANPPVNLTEYRLFHQVLRHRAADPCQVPLVAFPKTGNADFEYFTAVDLYRFANCAASLYEERGLRAHDSRTVAILGQTNIDWVVSTFALSTAGYTILTLSPRLSSMAIIKLLQETHCGCLVHSNTPPMLSVIQAMTASFDVQTIPMLSRVEFDNPERPLREFSDDPDQEKRPAFIMHSSGSTGLPKSLCLPHQRLVTEFPLPGDCRDLVTLPLFHTFALTIVPTRMYRRKTVHFLNPDLPITCEGLTQAIEVARPQLLSTVPYLLKLLAEESRGIDALRSCDYVMTTGSQTPDDLGNHLIDLGVNLSTLFGSTECGFVAASTTRPKDDKVWEYIRVPDHHMKHILPSAVAEDLYEFVFLGTYPRKVVTNSDDPPDSFHSKDLFTPHPTIPSAWKYVTRIDDRVTLLNGEKVLPLPIEGRIRQHAFVREAVVFGIGKAVPGILLFRADDAKELPDGDFVDKVWPAIEEANQHAESFSQISRDMVVPLPSGIGLAYTDKGTFIRAQVYKAFEKDIEQTYNNLENQDEGTVILDHAALVDYLFDLFQQLLGTQISTPDEDLFGLGINSLQAIEIRGAILKHLNLGGNGRKLSQNVVFEQGNILNLAKHLNALRLGTAVAKEKPIRQIKEMAAKYAVAPQPHQETCHRSKENVIVLTGATGGLGVHLLTQLANHPRTSHIYCLLRGQDAAIRLKRSVIERHHLSLPPPDKYTVLISSLHEPNLGLSNKTYATLKERTTHIIHSAWPVNFQVGLPSFSSSLQGLRNLLTLSLSTNTGPRPARLVFCSSISVALDAPPSTKIPEAPIADLGYVSGTGYAASKLVGEKMIESADRDTGANASVVRIGQMVGDTRVGLWNDTEMVPLMIRSALTMDILPKLDGERCCWLPIDICAKAIIEIEGLEISTGDEKGEEGRRLLYNLSSPLSFRWNRDLLPALKGLGLRFETVPFSTWIDRLRNLAGKTAIVTQSGDNVENGEGSVILQNNGHPPIQTEMATVLPLAADPEQNPALKLVDFYEESYGGDPGRHEGDGIVFATDMAETASSSLRNMEGVIESGLLGKMLSVWLRRWKEERECANGQ